MMINFYINEKRIRELAFQLDSKSLNQVTNKTDKSASLNTSLKGGMPSWLKLIGFEGEGSLGSEGKLMHSKEEKPISIDNAILFFLKESLVKSNINYIDNNTLFKDINLSKHIYRVQGLFSPMVEGINGLERIAHFQTMEYIEWIGDFNNLNIKFGTTKESYTGRTAIFQCLNNYNKSLKIDFFGLFSTLQNDVNNRDKQVLSLLPLFFGVEINI